MGHNWQTGETITAALLNGVAQIADIGTPGTPTGDALKAAYATRTRNLLARLNSNPTTTPVLASPPTVTYSTGSTLYNQQMVPLSNVSLLGMSASVDPGTGKTFTNTTGTVGVDFYVTAQQVEVVWYSQATNAEKTWLWVDGQPVTAAPVLPLATAAGQENACKIDFGSVGRHRVTFYAATINAWHFIATTIGGAVQAAPRRARIAFVGDSFFDSSAAIANPIDSAPFPCATLLSAECIQAGLGGSGYQAAPGYDATNFFGSTKRVSFVSALAPDLVVINGSVNDASSGLQAAASAAYAAYAAALPGVPVIVFGPQPTNGVDTIGSSRQAQVAAVKAAAIAAPNVIAFHDRCGTAAGIPAAWSSGATYSEGALVTYLGSVWQWKNGGTSGNESSPRTSLRWSLVTWDYIGTGQVGSTTGDGNRDTFLYSDGTHPTPTAAQADAAHMAGAITADLAAH